MSGRLRCGQCRTVLHDVRPRNLSAAERVAQAAERRRVAERERNNDPTGVTAAEVDAQLDRANKQRPLARTWTGRDEEPKTYGHWAIAAENKVALVLRCPRCRVRFPPISEPELNRRTKEARRRGEDVWLTTA